VNSLAEMVDVLRQYDNYLIVAHENPDPDSIGSMIAMYRFLQLIGKNARMICADPIPPYPWPNIEHIQASADTAFENVIILDCEPTRTGKLLPLIKQAKLSFNIDHHEGNGAYCDYNYIDTNQAATCMIIYQLLQVAGVTVDTQLAIALYAGIIGDTGGFRHANTTEDVFRVAADLVAHGANPNLTAQVIFESKPIEFMRFLGYALGKLQTGLNQRLVWLALTYEDFNRYGIDPRQSDQIIDYTRMVEGCEIAILFREVSPNMIRIGFRSRRMPIHQLAVQFGGGGHLLAAGASVAGPLDETVQKVIAAAAQLLEGDSQ